MDHVRTDIPRDAASGRAADGRTRSPAGSGLVPRRRSSSLVPAMAKQLPPYSLLKAQFPARSLPEVKALIGGGVDAEYITNGCVIRVSRALNYAGAPIPAGVRGLMTVPGGDGKRYALRVAEFRRYLRAAYGPPSRTAPGGAVAEGFRGAQGIILFDVRGWSDATGHADLWNGEACEYEGYWPQAFEVLLWRTAGASTRTG